MARNVKIENKVESNYQMNVTLSGEEKIAALEREVQNLNADLDSMTQQYEAAAAAAERFKAAADSAAIESGLAALREELVMFKSTASEAAMEFDAFLRAARLTDTNDTGFEKFRGLFNQIEEGSKTAQQAIVEVKQAYASVIEENWSKNGGMFDAQQIQQFDATLTKLGTTLSEVLARVTEMQTQGVQVNGEFASSGASVASTLQQIEAAARNMDDDLLGSYEAIAKLTSAMNEYASIDSGKLETIASTFRNMAKIGEGNFGGKSLSNLTEFFAQAQRLGDGSGTIRLNVSGFESLSGLKTSKTWGDHLTTLGTAVKALNVNKLQSVAAIDFSNLTNFKMSKSTADNLFNLTNAMKQIDQLSVKVKALSDAEAKAASTSKSNSIFAPDTERLNHVTAVLKEIDASMATVTASYKKMLTNDGASTQELDGLREKYIALQEAIDKVRTNKGTASDEDIAKIRQLQTETNQLIESINKRITAEKEAEAAKQKAAADKAAEDAKKEAQAQREAAEALKQKAQAEKEAASAAKQAETEEMQRANALKQYQTLLSQINSAQRNYSAAAKSSAESSRTSYENYSVQAEKVRELFKAYQSGEISYKQFSAGIATASASVKASTDTIKANGDAAQTLSERLSGLAGKFSAWLSVSQVIMYSIRSIKELVNASIELDDALTQLKIVTNETDSTYQKFSENISKSAQQLGTSTKDLIDTTTTYARLGYTLDESQQLAKFTGMLQQVGNIEAQDAQDAMTSMIKAFDLNIDDIESVMDKLVMVGNGAPISVSQIAEAMTNASSTMAAAGNDINQTIALMTAANTTLQNAARSSTGLRTITARIRKTKTELDDLGEALSDSDYNKMIEALSKITLQDGTTTSVSLKDVNGEYRETYDILADLAAIWNQLDSMSQAGIAEKLAGTRMQDVFFSIMNNWEEAKNAMELMSEDNSAGALADAYNTHLDSTTAHINAFKAAFAELGQNAFNSDFLKGFIDFGTGLINILNSITKVVNAFGGLKTVLVGLAGTLATINAVKIWSFLTDIPSKISAFGSSIMSMISQIALLPQAFTMASSGAMTLDAAMATLGITFTSVELAFAAVAAALTAGIALYTKFKQHQEEVRQEAFQTATAATDEAEAFEKNYITISQYLGQTGLTAEQESELQSAIENVSGALDGKVTSLAEFENAKAQATIARDAAQDTLVDNAHGWTGSKVDFSINDRGNLDEETKAAVGHMRKVLGDAFTEEFNGHGNNVYTTYIADAVNSKDANSVADYYYKLVDLQQSLAAEGLTNNDIYDQTTEKIGELKESVGDYAGALYDELRLDYEARNGIPKTVEEYMAMEEAVLSNVSAYGSLSGEMQDLMRTDYGKYFDIDGFIAQSEGATESAEEVAEAVQTVQEATENKVSFKDLFTTEDGKDSDFKQQVDEYVSSMKKLKAAQDKISDGTFTGKDFKDLIEDFPELATRADDLGVAIDEVMNSLTGVSDEAGESSGILAVFEDALAQCATDEDRASLLAYIETIAHLNDEADNFKETIGGVMESQKNVISALASSASEAGLTAEEIKNVDAAFRGLDSYDPEALFIRTANGVRLNTEEVKRLNNELSQSTSAEILTKIRNAQFALGQAKAQGLDTSAYEQEIFELQLLQSEYDATLSAYQNFINAKNTPDKRDSLAGVGKAYEDMEALFKGGWWGDEELGSYLDLLLGDRRTGDVAEDWSKLNDKIQDTNYSLRDFMTFDDKGNLTEQGIDRMLKTCQELNPELAHLDENGEWFFDMSDEAISYWAEKLGTSEDMIRLFAQAMEDAGLELDTGDYTSEIETVKGKIAEVQGILSELDAAEADPTVNVDSSAADAAVSELAAELAELPQEELVEIGFTPSDGETITAEDIKAQIGTVNVDVVPTVTGDTTGSTVTNTTENKEVNTTENTTTTTLEATDNASSTITTVQGLLDKYASTSAKPTVGIVDNASGAISSISSSLGSLNGKTAHTYTYHHEITTKETQGGPGKAAGTATSIAYAGGSGRIALPRDQKALVNEEGVGAESIVRDGVWSIIPGGTHVESLKKGDIVFSKEQTEQLLKTGKISRGKRFGNAYLHGTLGALATGTTMDWGGGSGDSGGSGGSSSGSSGSGSSSSSKKKKTSSKKDSGKEVIDWVERRLKYFADSVKRIADTITDYVSSSVKKAKLIQQRSAIDKEITANQKGYDTYSKKASSIKLSADLKKKVREGNYSIKSYGKKTQDLINQYKEYYDKAQDCKDKVTELRNTQLELFDQLMHMPAEEAAKKIDKLSAAYDTLAAKASAAASGMSGIAALESVGQAAVASAKKTRDAAKDKKTSTQATRDKAKTSLDKAKTTTQAAKNKTAAAAKKLTKKDKKRKKDKNGYYSLSGLKKNSAQYKRLKAYNDALKAQKAAEAKQATAQGTYNAAQSAYSSANAAYAQENANYTSLQSLYATGNASTTYQFQNALIDSQLANQKKQNTANQQALTAANKNLSAAQSAQTSAKNAVSSKASSILKSYGKSLTAAQKKALQSGKAVSTKGLKGKALEAVKAYNKLVSTAATKTQELTIAQNAQQEAQETAAQSAAELAEAQVQAEKDKFDNVKKYYESQISYMDAQASKQQALNDVNTTKGIAMTASDYDKLISGTQDKINTLNTEATKLKSQLASAVKSGVIKDGSEEWREMQEEILATETAVANAQKQQEEYNNAVANLPFEKIEKAISLLDAIASYNKSLRDLKAAQGEFLTQDDYTSQITENNNKIAKLQQERAEAYNNYLKALANGNKVFGGKTADEWKQMYLGFDTDINGLKVDIEGIKDAMRDDVFWRTFDRAHEACKQLKTILSDIAELISDDMLFDKNGSFTEYGVAMVANLSKQYETARQEVQNYQKDIDNLNKLYKEGYYTQQEYTDKLNDLQDGMLGAAADMKKLSGQIVDMYKEQSKSELDALNKLIDARNDALKKKKAYYDYDKQIRSQTDDILSIQAQIAALSGIDSAEAKARRAQLEEELKGKQDDLDDTINDHIYDLSQEALDSLKDMLEEAFNDKWDNISSNLEQLVALMATANELSTASASTIAATLDRLLSAGYGIDSGASGINKKYASGTRRVPRKMTALTNEHGGELIVTKDGLITPLSPGDGVIPAKLTKRLYEMATSDYTDLMKMPSVRAPKVDSGLGGSGNVTQTFGNLINIEGSADAATVEDLKALSKNLLEESYKYTSSKIYSGYVRSGGRRTV